AGTATRDASRTRASALRPAWPTNARATSSTPGRPRRGRASFSRRPSRLDSDPPPPDDDLVQTAFAPTAAGAFPDPQPRRQPRDDVPQPDCPIGKRIDRCNGKRQALLELATLAVRQHVDIRMAPDLVLRRSIFQSDVCRLSSIEDERVALERIFQVRRGRPALEGRHRDPRSGTRPL